MAVPAGAADTIKKWHVTEPFLDLHCSLGEGPYYEPSTNSVRFVDIKKKRLHVVDVQLGMPSLKTLQLDMPVGVTADIEGVDPAQKILIGGKGGVFVLDRTTGEYALLRRFYDDDDDELEQRKERDLKRDERLRSNDGSVDPQGRFWIGTMNDFWVGQPQPEGTLFQFSSDLTRRAMRYPVTIPNGLGWSLDYRTMYFTHSTERRILAFDYSASDGSISNERVFFQHDGAGEPDGMVIDEEGFLWQAIYGEGRVLRISPQGRIVGEISLPTRCITCPLFVGTELWVTSAEEEDEGELESRRFGGGVFKVEVGVRGVKEFKFRLDPGLGGL